LKNGAITKDGPGASTFLNPALTGYRFSLTARVVFGLFFDRKIRQISRVNIYTAERTTLFSCFFFFVCFSPPDFVYEKWRRAEDLSSCLDGCVAWTALRVLAFRSFVALSDNSTFPVKRSYGRVGRRAGVRQTTTRDWTTAKLCGHVRRPPVWKSLRSSVCVTSVSRENRAIRPFLTRKLFTYLLGRQKRSRSE